mgnify:CR=1 FL=1
MTTILLVEDELALAKSLAQTLEATGAVVRLALNGEIALERFRRERPDLVLLDVMMPVMGGYETCAEIRKLDRDVPVIFLTALDSDADQIRGIELGGDDYVSKDTNDAVLLSRVRRALRRTDNIIGQTATAKIVIGSVVVDVDRRQVVDGTRVEELTRSEGGLIRCLASQRGEIFSVEKVFAFLRGKGYVGDESAVRAHVKNLRKKLGRAGDSIVTVKTFGYYLVK